MKIGLLQCDDVADSLRDVHGNYPDMIQNLLRAVEPDVQFQVWPCYQGEFPDPDADVDGWITTGSKCSAYDDEPWISDLSELIRVLWREQRPLVGICFGHQLIAQALGGRVERSRNGWGVGVSINQIDQQQPWMTPWQGEKLQLLSSHQDQVTALPEQGTVLAHSEHCPIYMMQVGDSILGIQGHPEFTKEYAADLMEMRRDIIPADVVGAGLHSLKLHVDDLLVARWVLNFIQRRRHSERTG